MRGYCIVCRNDIEITMCCSGRDCGCMGQPTEPPVCSEVCHNELFDNFEKYYPKGKQISLDEPDLSLSVEGETIEGIKASDSERASSITKLK